MLAVQPCILHCILIRFMTFGMAFQMAIDEQSGKTKHEHKFNGSMMLCAGQSWEEEEEESLSVSKSSLTLAKGAGRRGPAAR